ncbi:TetR/AcrR family transcriptional regulator [Actinophytocola sp.]|uniref:TetR/AcrR family transcriptional regulator n=1 Tax=Actinophytocola sp. TaxID=1872138 RepID=UPI003D6BD1AC
MASTYSQADRRSARRARTIEDALDAAEAIMREQGVGGLSMSEVARRLGMRQPSLYKYFSSLHALFDALFARGLARTDAAVTAAIRRRPPGVPRLRAGARALMRWAVENPALAQLLYWRPVPGFEPSAETFAASRDQMATVRTELAAAAGSGQLRAAAATDEALLLYTVVISGVISQQLANEPGASFAAGRFSRLTDEALDMYFARYAPAGGTDADPRP